MTDPARARSTKEERDKSRSYWKYFDVADDLLAIRILDDADAADALRAQVAALQVENEEERHLCDDIFRDRERLKTELAAAQAELAEARSHGHDEPCYYCAEPCNGLAGNPGLWPIGLPHEDEPGVLKWHHMRCVSARLSDNAALRTKAAALERERDDVDAEKATRQSMEDFGPGCKLYRRIEWYLRANDNNALLDSHTVITLIAEKP